MSEKTLFPQTPKGAVAQIAQARRALRQTEALIDKAETLLQALLAQGEQQAEFLRKLLQKE